MFIPLDVEAAQESNLITENLEKMFEKRRSTLMIIPAVSRQVLRVVQSMDNCILAGGAALELYTGDIYKIKDWDLFFTEPEGYREARNLFKKLEFQGTTRSDWSITLEKSDVIVQLITKYFPRDVHDLFKRFDFSVCCFAVKGSNIYYTKKAAEDVALKQINFNTSDNIISVIKRVARYGQKGYMPTTQCVKDILDGYDHIPEDGDLGS
jgi:hypothetical protein